MLIMINGNRLGVYIWGTTVIVIAAVTLYGVFFGDRKDPNGLHFRIKDCAGVLGPVIAAACLAWSWFYQVSQKEQQAASLSPKIESSTEKK